MYVFGSTAAFSLWGEGSNSFVLRGELLAPYTDGLVLGDTTCNFCDDNSCHIDLMPNRSLPIDRSATDRFLTLHFRLS